jgi:TonB dependent receptor
MRFISEGTINYLGVTPSETKLYNEVVTGTLPTALAAYGLTPMPYNSVPSYFLFGLNATYTVGDVGVLKGLQLFTQISNLFNKTPPFAGGGAAFGESNGGTNPIWFDALGLAYRVGFRANF